MTLLRVASVQMQHVAGDKAANLATMHGFADAAHASGVRILLFPEMCITGYWHVRNLSREQVAGLAEPVPEGDSSRMLMQWAQECDMTIAAGLIESAPDGRFYNTCVVAMPDGRFARHRKMHAFENEAISCGDEFTVFDTPHGCRVGVLICYDNNIVENVRINALMGAQVLLAPHQTGGCASRSPRAMGLVDHSAWESRADQPELIDAEFRGPKGRGWLMRWLPSRAHDNGLFLLFANGVGPDDNEIRTGNAMILDCYGEILAETCKAGNEMVIADLDFSIQPDCTGQRWLTVRRPELYTPLTRPTGRERTTREVRMGTKQP